MANIVSQKKRNRQNEVRRVRNLAVRSELKTRIKSARQAIATGDEHATEAVQRAQKRLGKAATKGVVAQERGRPPHLAADEGRQPRSRQRQLASAARLRARPRPAPRGSHSGGGRRAAPR